MFFSVVITTYNAETFVLDALGSLKNQSFQDFEWIITDDCSTDRTVEICQTWIAENPEFQSRIRILESAVNTGVSANVNRGLKVSSGEWIYVLSADDALFAYTLENVHDFVCENPEICVFQGIASVYENCFSDENFIGNLSENYKTSDFFKVSASKQYRFLLNSCYLVAPAVFYKKQIVEEVGLCDETIPMIDDWPLWLKFSGHGYKFYFWNRILIKYRQHKTSIVNENRGLLTDDLHRKCRPVYRAYIAPNIGVFRKIKYHLKYIFKEFLYRFLNSKNNCIAIFMLSIWRIFKQPFLIKNSK